MKNNANFPRFRIRALSVYGSTAGEQRMMKRTIALAKSCECYGAQRNGSTLRPAASNHIKQPPYKKPKPCSEG